METRVDQVWSLHLYEVYLAFDTNFHHSSLLKTFVCDMQDTTVYFATTVFMYI